MVLLLKVFHRLLNYSFDTIVRGETLTAPQQKSQKRISRHILFFAYGRRSNDVFLCLFKSAEGAGNFVACSLEVSLRIICFRLLFGLPV